MLNMHINKQNTEDTTKVTNKSKKRDYETSQAKQIILSVYPEFKKYMFCNICKKKKIFQKHV